MESKQSDWIEWSGGPCPVAPNVIVNWRLRREKDDPLDSPDLAYKAPAYWLIWTHGPADDDIIAYRIVQP